MGNRYDRKPDSGRGSGWLKYLIFGAVIIFFWTRSRHKAAPAYVPRPPAEAAQAASKAEWPPTAPAGEKADLAQDLSMRNYYVILDGSGSMADQGCSGSLSKMDAAKEALAKFASVVPAKAQLGLLAFDGRGVSERVPLGLDNRERFAEEVRKVASGGQTPLKTAISQGVAKLEEAARRQLGYGEYNLVVVTDGEAVPGSEDPTEVVNDVLGRSPVAIHTIGFCIGTNHSLNQPGRTLYKAAQNPEELKSGLGEVLAESEKFDVSGFK